MVIRWGDWQRKLTARKREHVAFVLSGGGPFGAVQAGILEALLESGIVPDHIVGTSVGALNGVFLASDPTVAGARRLGDMWRAFRRDDLFPGGKFVSVWHAVKKGSYVYSNSGLRRIITTSLECKQFEDLKVPAHVIATNLVTGEETWFSSGQILEPLLASSAMPGVFPPVDIDGITYIDGGISNNIPVSRAIEVGARTVYVINVNAAGQGRLLNRPYDFLMHGLVLSRAQRYRRDMERYRVEANIVEMPMVDVGHVAFRDLSKTSAMIQAGYDTACEFLAKVPEPRGRPKAIMR